MASLKRQQVEDLSGGVQNKTSDALMTPNQLKHTINGEFKTKIGTITGRKGSERQSIVVASDPILNMFKWIKNDGTVKYFAVSDDSQATPKVDIYVSSNSTFAGTWSKSLEDWATDLPVYAENFANKLYVFNGVTAVQAFDGSSWAAVTNAPAAGLYPVVYNQRLYVLTASGYLHYSDVINSTGDDFTTTTWTNRGINPNDGQVCRMAIRHRGRIVIFKDESIYRYDGTNEPEAVITIGTRSGKSVVINSDIFFHHPTGIYKMGAGEPVVISRAVQKYLEGMSVANWSNVASGKDKEHVYFWIGDVTISDPLEFDYGQTYTDTVLVYNIYAQNWTVFTGWNARVWYYDEANGDTYYGTALGKIFKINTNYVDKDDTTLTPIDFQVVFRPEDYGFPEKDKEFGQIFVLGDYDSDILAGTSFAEMQNSSQLSYGKGIVNSNITGKELWFGVTEEYSNTPPRINGYILDRVNLLDDAN